mmetsp:Transcript_52059/g.106141  ORF Transcript_52059/g.106141 Transcript_52059/m.106141 type:complete len:147 (+) Transcript_52059:37-477(+)|eukprot:CAMPEP_0181325294 /NCGR_PEP_ID=MMETSP1101-20121128/20841_1 /TAXON_ID=46948 /ORGANISM="Rhodomonas abbreviata, Strain Caron Lab Isolate" /LENGTH=146 /DNA_ID=CAMNT_0023433577 /DNA_START=37 /DNA_END=477 /DNA_ORIENTATION=-
MVVKTELCAFSEYRIYPGHGIKFVRRDGQPVLLGSSKAKSLLADRKKPSKLMWTQAWRRLNKKARDDGVVRKKARRAVKVQRAIVGASLADLTAKRQASKPKPAKASAEATKEVKKRVKGPQTGGAVRVPKNQKSHTGGKTGGVRR